MNATEEQEIATRLAGRIVDEVYPEIDEAQWKKHYLEIDGDLRLTGRIIRANDRSKDWLVRVGPTGWTQLIERRVAEAAGWRCGELFASETVA